MRIGRGTEDHIGFIDKTGTFVIPSKFGQGFPFSDGRARFRNSLKEKWGYIDLNGNVAIRQRFDDAEPFYGGLAGVTINGKDGYVDTNGNLIKVRIPDGK